MSDKIGVGLVVPSIHSPATCASLEAETCTEDRDDATGSEWPPHPPGVYALSDFPGVSRADQKSSCGCGCAWTPKGCFGWGNRPCLRGNLFRACSCQNNLDALRAGCMEHEIEEGTTSIDFGLRWPPCLAFSCILSFKY